LRKCQRLKGQGINFIEPYFAIFEIGENPLDKILYIHPFLMGFKHGPTLAGNWLAGVT
jgi:hypothetical protein